MDIRPGPSYEDPGIMLHTVIESGNFRQVELHMAVGHGTGHQTGCALNRMRSKPEARSLCSGRVRLDFIFLPHACGSQSHPRVGLQSYLRFEGGTRGPNIF